MKDKIKKILPDSRIEVEAVKDCSHYDGNRSAYCDGYESGMQQARHILIDELEVEERNYSNPNSVCGANKIGTWCISCNQQSGCKIYRDIDKPKQ